MVIAYLSAGQHGQAILTMALLTISMTSPPPIDRLACLFPSLQRGAGTELVVEMQDLLNVTHARAVLGRGIPGAYAQVSLQRLTRCLHQTSCFGMPSGCAHVCCGMRGLPGEATTGPHRVKATCGSYAPIGERIGKG